MKLLLSGLLFIAFGIQAQTKKAFDIHPTTEKITIDGALNETAWQTADILTDFTQNYPSDTLTANAKTEVRIMHNDKYIYVSAVCYHATGYKPLVQSLKRDFSYPVTDAFAVYLSPLNDNTNGFNFTVDPYGVQREGILTNGGMSGVTTAWDNKWFSEVSRHENFYVVEMAIPFKTLRYKKDIETWGINFSRNDLSLHENSAWSRVPRGFNIGSLAYTGDMHFIKSLTSQGLNAAIIPYIKGGARFDNMANHEVRAKNIYGLGGDAKISLSPSLNLDLTVNPDFSQVEVDAQVVNLDRFSVLLPEQRQFFQENSDLFAMNGFSKIRPFFTRRIGLSDKGEPIPIIAGLRLSGNISKSTRIGLLNMQTAADAENNITQQNYSVAIVEQKVWGKSNITGIVVNRQAFEKFHPLDSNFNTIVGADYNLYSKNNYWRGKLFFHQSFTQRKEKDRAATALWLRFQTSHWEAEYNHEYVGENYNADAGFVLRKNYWRWEPIIGYTFFSKKKKLNNWILRLYNSTYTDKNLGITDFILQPTVRFNFTNYSWLQFYAYEMKTRLDAPFDPSGIGNILLQPGVYNYRNAGGRYESDFRKKFAWKLESNYGSFFSGNKFTLLAEATCRFTPFGFVTLSYQRNELRFPESKDAFLDLVGAKVQATFTRDIYFNTYLQYNRQSNNFNINARFQWRLKPMSDLFFVYTDNYDNSLKAKNRAFVIKLSYWFGV